MKMISVVAVALFTIGIAGAADEPTTNKAPRQDATTAEQDGAPVGTRVQASGKVTSIHNLTLANNNDPHVLAKLQTEEGDVEIVDLGAASELKNNKIEPKEGQMFWVEGRVGKINDKFLIVAERLSESRLITINRTAPLREESQKHADSASASANTNTNTDNRQPQDVKNNARDANAPKTETADAGQHFQTVEGTVIHSKHVMIQGEPNEHVLAKLQTENGIAIVDLGTCAAMPESVSLAEGKMLAVSGVVGKLNGKPVIMAETVGNMAEVQRPQAVQTSNTPSPR